MLAWIIKPTSKDESIRVIEETGSLVHYQYRADRARRSLRGVDEQVAKAEGRRRQDCGQTQPVRRPVRRGEVGQLQPGGQGGSHQGSHPGRLEGLHHQPGRPEPGVRHRRETIDAYLTIVFAALAVARFVEETTGWSIKKFVRTTRRYRTVQIKVGQHTVTAEDPVRRPTRHARTDQLSGCALA